jgi:serine/threonine-protein kinase
VADPVDPDRWRRIEEVLDAALDLPPGQRKRFLDEACAADAALRSEVESLLAADARAKDYLEVPVGSLQSVLSAPYRSGQRIGPYRLLRELGRGGLGIVYLAVDTRLGRQVALKLLPASRTADPEARARFQREARAASALDHPNICTIYEIDESEAGDPYIAMAFVEGETLKEKIARGPLALSEAIDFAAQTARGLAYAHDRGIVHRDIKPANLIVTPSGQVEIVDFGLAKWQGASTLTREGVTPGTVCYMSPEQIQGKEVDRRTDIWALGVVLYEMITGRPPFRGEHEQARTYAILNQDPEPLTALRADVPLALEPVLAKVLAKDAEKRYQHVDELPVDLRSALEQRAGLIPGATGSSRRLGRWSRLSLALAGAVAVVLSAALAFDRIVGSGEQPVMHLSVTLPPEQELVSEGTRRLAISPDGTRLVYAARSGGRGQLYLRPLDRSDSRPIPGTENARDPFFSPDGRWVGFFANEELRKVSLDGGAPQKICDAPAETSRGASWGPDGTIVLPLGQLSGLFRVSDAGGVPEPLTIPSDDSRRSAHFFPQILPDGQSVLFTVWSGTEWRTAILDLGTGAWDEIAEGCAAARYISTGHLVCVEMAGVRTTGSFLAAPFTLERRALADPFVSLPRPSGLHAFDFATSATGTLVYATRSSFAGRMGLVWVDREGRVTRFPADVDGSFAPAVSPDGSEVTVTRVVEAGRQELWLYDLTNHTLARLSAASTVSNLPRWSPDGERIVFNSLQSPPGLYWMPRDQSDSARLLLPRREHILVPGSFSADGRLLAYTELNDRTLGDLWTLSLDDGSLTPLVRTSANERGPEFSSNGHWLAFTSDVSGRDEVYVQAYPGPGAPIQISTGGGREPVWSPDGTELFYRQGDAMMAVSVETDGDVAAGPPVKLFEGRYATEYLGVPHYDVAPDGRFLMVEVEATSASVRLDIVLNWFDELDRLVATGG